ncbi:MAG: glycerol-3-phosphate dehydrogenase/oxidase [Deltaproteobacteria bacterium]|nr:glycerol-3-phosphate dehydrogenase/oxidase [Deltaproteobacteria bacterium]MBW2723682.1 glycerol-3-phosphate dehydrogenase/oxidase [Deltaproteobacteria bacterium]
MFSSRLGPAERAEALDRMERESFDIAIIGGGVTGAGAALDAASRGLSVALVEQRDWAAGTSSRSSKLIHGGIRYLEQLEFALVREALREQSLMINTLCPHLVRPIRFLMPLTRHVIDRVYIGAGVMLYDALPGSRSLERHRHRTRRSALARFPGLKRSALVGAIEFSDAQVDDARHTLALVRTAATHGAAVASSASVVDLVETGSRVTGAEVECLESGRRLRLRARQFINATGVWTDEVQSMAGRGRIQVRASKGIHLVVPRDRIPGDCGLVLRTKTSVLFVIPWKHHWIIGTTDTDWTLDLAHPAASRSDIDYLLETLNGVLAVPLRHEDIEGVYAGLRPLLHGESDATSQLSRTHAVSQSVSGLITVAGGKYTTYRVMAEDAIDLAARSLEKKVPVSCTDSIPLVGSDYGYPAVWNRREVIAQQSGLHLQQIEHLLSRYGTRIFDLLEMISERPELADSIPGTKTYLCVEAAYGASHEGALHVEDVLTRRTRISIETFDRGTRAAERVAQEMGRVLGWDADKRRREVDHYLLRVQAERDSQEQPDDLSADAARLGAPDLREFGSERSSKVVRLIDASDAADADSAS